jgi:hypothetical protein
MATTEATASEPRKNDIMDDAVLVPNQGKSILVDAKNEEKAPKTEETPEYVKTIDRMGNELGELRKANKELQTKLEAVMQQGQAAQEASVRAEPVNFDDDPAGYVQQAVKAAMEEAIAPQLNVLADDLHRRKADAFDHAVSQSYPDWKETAQSEGFADWVKANPARMQMYQLADANFDSDSAVELLKRFRQDQADAKDSEQGAIQAAGLVSGGGSTGGKQVFAASEIRSMMQNDPEGYKRWMSQEGYKAYSEGRVDQSR